MPLLPRSFLPAFNEGTLTISLQFNPGISLAESARVGAIAGNAKVGNRVNWWTRWQALEYVTSQNFERRALNVLGAVSADDQYAGGLIPVQNWYAPSLTSNRESGLGQWDVEDIVGLLHAGVSRRGAVYGPMAQVVHDSLQYLTESDVRAMAEVPLVIVAVFALVAKNLVRGRVGRSWMAIRDRDIAAEIIGVRPLRTKLLAFAISSFFLPWKRGAAATARVSMPWYTASGSRARAAQ